MTELQLYKFIHDNGIEYHYDSGKKIFYGFIEYYHIGDFVELMGNASYFDDGGVEVTWKGNYIAVNLTDICEYFCIDEDNIFDKTNQKGAKTMGKIELQEDCKYEFADMTIIATTDSDFNPILKISTYEGNIIILPSQRDEIIVKSTVD